MLKIIFNPILLTTIMPSYTSMWRTIMLSTFIISLMILGVSNNAFADVFSQNPIVRDHTNILNITDATYVGNTITVTVNSPPTSFWNFIFVDLNRVGTSNDFRSEFITFTSGPTNDAANKLNVAVGNLVKVKRGATTWTASVISNNDPLDPTYNSSTAIPTLLGEFNSQCTTLYGPSGTDSDNDFICNNWETPNGLEINYPTGSNYHLPCTLPGVDASYDIDPLGTTICPSTTVKDMYVEIDYMRGHKPDLDALKNVTKALRSAPVNKINLHVILDEQLNHVSAVHFPGIDQTPGFIQIKSKEFGTDAERQSSANWSLDYAAKAQVFQYFLWGHDVIVGGAPPGSTPSGIADGANDGAVTLGSFTATVAGFRNMEAGTFMHELGHNLGLGHGGARFDQNICKPNLISVMNYQYQFGDLAPDFVLDYSRSTIGTNTAGSTSLGMESSLAGTGMNVANSVPPNLYMVYGIGNGQSSFKQLPQTLPSSNNWPTSWDSIRHLADSQGHTFCPKPTTAINLIGVDQWSIISMSHIIGDWDLGITTGSPLQVSQSAPVSLWTDKPDYLIGDTVQVNGTVSNISADPVIVKVIASNGNVVTVDQLYLNSNGAFGTVLTSGGIWNQEGSYTIEATYQRLKNQVSINMNNVGFEIPKGSWCISLEEAQKQSKLYNLDINNAPLCYTEITMNEVRAARSINVDNLIGKIKSLNSADFTNEKSQSDLIAAAEDIRTLIFADDVYETIASYDEFINLIDKNIKSDSNARQELIDIVKFNNYAVNPDGITPPGPTNVIDVFLRLLEAFIADYWWTILVIAIVIWIIYKVLKNRGNKESKQA